MWSFWLVFCDCGCSMSALWCPLFAPTILLGFLVPWIGGISSQLLQQWAATALYLGRWVSPHGHHSWPWTWGISSQLPLCCAAATPAPGSHWGHIYTQRYLILEKNNNVSVKKNQRNDWTKSGKFHTTGYWATNETYTYRYLYMY